jgi:hypothetical protein
MSNYQESGSKRMLSDWQYGSLFTLLAVSLGLTVVDNLKSAKEKKPSFDQTSINEETASAINGFTLVYKDQKQPNCIGDVEKTVPQINKKGDVTGMVIYCKPVAAEPAK